VKEFLRRSPRYFTPRKNAEQQIPEEMFRKCSGCGDLVYMKEWEDNAKVCPKCNFHDRLTVDERLSSLVDPGSWQEYDAELAPDDPLHFVSPKDKYDQKVAGIQSSLGKLDAALSGTGTIETCAVALCVHDFAFLAGSMGAVVGEKIARSAERAAERQMPLVTVNTSGGARMHEGILSLMQMAKVSVALARLGEAGQPHISLLVDPCMGGVTASHASAADVIIAEPGAVIGFAGRRVIEQTIRQKLPPDFQTAEFQLEHGMVDMVVPRMELRSVIGRLLRLYA